MRPGGAKEVMELMGVDGGAVEAAEGERKTISWLREAMVTPIMLLVLGVFASLFLFVSLSGNGRWWSFFTCSPQTPSASVRATGLHTTFPGSSMAAAPLPDRPLGGLLSLAFDDQSCLSRYRTALYRRSSPFPASRYLIRRLRSYEAYHKKCGPHSQLFNQSVMRLRSGRSQAEPECKYVVWIPKNGLGNCMFTLASTFLYALLTGRVLLAHLAAESTTDLFCEPFPGSSWLLPADFPIADFGQDTHSYAESYKNMLQNHVLDGASGPNMSADAFPAYVLVDLVLSFTDVFFCDADQAVLHLFNWMVVKSDVYFAAALFLMPAYRYELQQMFPEKQSVFHHLGRYLFHPANTVWGIVTRFYDAYLAGADDRLGLQVRNFPYVAVPLPQVLDQILRCSQQERFFPEIAQADPSNMSSHDNSARMTAILVTSLKAGYYERIKEMYYANPTTTGEVVGIFQPSNEVEQHTEARNHNQKALAEIVLLSFSDRIITTAFSTFGGVAHGLAGLRPRILLMPPGKDMAAEPPCVWSESAEQCLHVPPQHVCGVQRGADLGAVVPYVRHCEDVGMGLKLF